MIYVICSLVIYIVNLVIYIKRLAIMEFEISRMNRDAKSRPLVVAKISRHIRREMWYSRKGVSRLRTRARCQTRAFLGYAVRRDVCETRRARNATTRSAINPAAANNSRLNLAIVRFSRDEGGTKTETETEKKKKKKEDDRPYLSSSDSVCNSCGVRLISSVSCAIFSALARRDCASAA